MSCQRCGSKTQNTRLCPTCARQQHQDDRNLDVEWHECATEGCELDAAGPDTVCRHCRPNHDGCPVCMPDNDPSPVEAGGVDR